MVGLMVFVFALLLGAVARIAMGVAEQRLDRRVRLPGASRVRKTK
jgi:hypothetical protein